MARRRGTSSADVRRHRLRPADLEAQPVRADHGYLFAFVSVSCFDAGLPALAVDDDEAIGIERRACDGRPPDECLGPGGDARTLPQPEREKEVGQRHYGRAEDKGPHEPCRDDARQTQYKCTDKNKPRRHGYRVP